MSIDALSIVVFPSNSHWREAVAHFLQCNFGVSGWEEGAGWRGYENSARIGGCLVAWGGEGQRGSVLIDMPGSVCALCEDWATVVEWIELFNGRITRCDVAGDDFFGVEVNIEWALQQRIDGGFLNGGRPPSFRLIDDLGSGDGRTLYVGKRENGKLARIYEKGRELGDKLSKWCRFEVEFRSVDRVVPLDILTSPAKFLAGSFPCARMFSTVVERIRTYREKASISYAKAVSVARIHAGRVVNAILIATGGDIGAVVSLLRRAGLPRRLDPADMMRLSTA